MTLHRIPLPDEVSAPGDIAWADQQHAVIRAALDKLVADAGKHVIGRGFDPDDVGVWTQACLSGPLEAAIDLAGDDDAETVMAMLVGLLGEAVLRLAKETT